MIIVVSLSLSENGVIDVDDNDEYDDYDYYDELDKSIISSSTTYTL